MSFYFTYNLCYHNIIIHYSAGIDLDNLHISAIVIVFVIMITTIFPLYLPTFLGDFCEVHKLQAISNWKLYSIP